MAADILSACASVALALIVALPLGPALRRCPAAFYGVAGVLVGVYLCYHFARVYVPGAQVLVDVVQKGYLACSLLAVVMFTGVFDERSALRRRLQMVRAELSVLSFVLILGHVAAFIPSYLPTLSAVFSANALVASSVVVAALLALVYALLTAISLRALRTRIPHGVWKALQRLSYAMVALLYAHILLVLGRSAIVGHGSASAAVALAFYTVLAVAYAVLRVRKYLVVDRARRSAHHADAVGARQAAAQGGAARRGRCEGM